MEKGPPTWKYLLYDFTQDTTLHGLRFVTRDTKVLDKKVITVGSFSSLNFGRASNFGEIFVKKLGEAFQIFVNCQNWQYCHFVIFVSI